MVEIGGATEAHEPIAAVDVHDVQSDSWDTVAELNKPRSNNSSCLASEYIYTFGGAEAGGRRSNSNQG